MTENKNTEIKFVEDGTKVVVAESNKAAKALVENGQFAVASMQDMTQQAIEFIMKQAATVNFAGIEMSNASAARSYIVSRKPSSMLRNLREFFESEEYGLMNEAIVSLNGNTKAVPNFYTNLFEIKVDAKSFDELNESGYVLYNEFGVMQKVFVVRGNVMENIFDAEDTIQLLKDANGTNALQDTVKRHNLQKLHMLSYSPGSVKDGRAFCVTIQNDTTGRLNELEAIATSHISDYFQRTISNLGDLCKTKDLVKMSTRGSQTLAPSTDIAEGLTANDVDFEALYVCDERLRNTGLKDGRELMSVKTFTRMLNNMAQILGLNFTFEEKYVIKYSLQGRLQNASKSGITLMQDKQLAHIVAMNEGLNVLFVTLAEWNKLAASDEFEVACEKYDAIAVSNKYANHANRKFSKIKPTVITSPDEVKAPWFFDGEEGNESISLPILKVVGDHAIQHKNFSYQAMNSINTPDAMQNGKDIVFAETKAEVLAAFPGLQNDPDRLFELVTAAVKNKPSVAQRVFLNTVQLIENKTMDWVFDEETSKMRLRDYNAPQSNKLGLELGNAFMRDLNMLVAPQMVDKFEKSTIDAKVTNFVKSASTTLGKKTRALVEQLYAVGTPNTSVYFMYTMDEVATYLEENNAYDLSTPVDEVPASRKTHFRLTKQLIAMRKQVEAQLVEINKTYHEVDKRSYMQIRQDVEDVIAGIEFKDENGKVYTNIFEALQYEELMFSPSVILSGEIYSKAAEKHAKKLGVTLEELSCLVVRYPKPGEYDAPTFRFVSLETIKKRIEIKKEQFAAKEMGSRTKTRKVKSNGKIVTKTDVIADLAAKYTEQFFKSRSTGEIVFPVDINVNLLLSGSDWDIDSFSVIFDQDIVALMNNVTSEIRRTDDLL